jgi:hypothetical protein
MRLRLKLDPLLVNWGGPDERVTDRCSVCEAPFDEEDIPLCMWSSEGWAARFCDACVAKHVEVEKTP